MPDYEKQRHFTERDSVVLRLRLLPGLGLDPTAQDGKYILETVEERMKKPSGTTVIGEFLEAYRRLITGEDLPDDKKPTAKQLQPTIFIADNSPFRDAVYVVGCKLHTIVYIHPNIPPGTRYTFTRHIQEGRLLRRGGQKPKRIRYELKHLTASNGQKKESRYAARTNSEDPDIFVDRVERIIAMGPPQEGHPTEPIYFDNENPLTWFHLQNE